MVRRRRQTILFFRSLILLFRSFHQFIYCLQLRIRLFFNVDAERFEKGGVASQGYLYIYFIGCDIPVYPQAVAAECTGRCPKDKFRAV